MKKITKIMFIIFIILLSFGLATYIDYYIVKTKNTTPKIAIKKDVNDNLVVYNAFMYRIWFCKSSGKYTLGDYKDSDAVCFSKDSYDKDGNYISEVNVLISKENLELLSEYYNSEEINKMSQTDIDDSVLLLKEYGRKIYKVLDTEEANEIKSKLDYDIVIFPKYKLIDNKYEWIYEENEYYCMKDNEFALYENEKCNAFTKLSISQKACEIYNRGVLNNKVNIDGLCVE